LIGGGVIGTMMQMPVLITVAVFVGYIWLLLGMVYFNVYRTRYMTSELSLGDVQFEAQPKTRTIIRIVLLNGLLLMLASLVLFAILAGVFWLMFCNILGADMATTPPSTAGLVVVAIMYLFALVVIGALSLVMISQPIIDHVVSSVTVKNAGWLENVRQREGVTDADAEGFADALDIGGI